ncbi:MAG: hypothetical protein LQ352_001219 [Teloschistes flavicans]|nr:MAG: hypothetical protein LQ352_001219 [Teloschistes flavicans]
MDPLSFTASLFAIIGGIQAGAKGVRTIAAYRYAPQEINALLVELERFEILLQSTITLVEGIDDETLKTRGLVLAQEVGKASTKINQINILLTAPHGLIAKLNDAKQEKITWARNKKKIKGLRADLKDSWLTINYALGILTASSMQGLRQSINTCITLGVENSEKLSGLVERTAETPADADSGKITIPSDNSFIGSETPSTSGAPRTPVVSNESALSARKKDDSSLAWQITPKESRKCKSWCSCRCHTRKTFIMPCLLTSVFGHFILEYSNTGPKCNEHSCLRSKATSLNLNYNFPWYVSAARLAFTMDHTPMYGTRFNLRIPKTMDWEHLLWGYANHGQIGAIQKLFSEGKASPLDVNLLGESALNYAAQHPRLYEFLVRHGGDQELADVHGYKPHELIGERLLSAELEEEDAHTISKLLEETDFMDTRHFTTIHKIVLGIVKRSLNEELDISTASIDFVDSKGRTPLAWATIRNDLQAVSTLHGFGADPNIRDDNGDSCLHFVRSPEVCSALLEAKADVHISNKTLGASCMQAVCKRFDAPEVIDLLHNAGADVNHRDHDKESPLLNAIFKKHTRTARRLIELGADVNAANKSSGDSAVTFAVSFNHYEILPTLLEYGADYTVPMSCGRGFAHMAAQFGELELLKALATLDLHKIDLSLRCAKGKTAEDYMNERDFFPDSEIETREAFQMFQQSISQARTVMDREGSQALPCGGSESQYRLPGAYPV